MPITYWTSLIGSLALIGFPGFAGFYSKDAIIVAAVHASHIPGSQLVYIAVLLGVFITALYSFRMFFLVFHGKERMDDHTREHLHESPWVVTVPLILLAIPSVIAGYVAPSIFGTYFGDAIKVLPNHDTLANVAEHLEHGVHSFTLHGLLTAPFWLALAGIFTAWYLYMKRPDIPGLIQARLQWLYTIMINKYGFDRFNEIVFAGGGRKLGQKLWRIGDVKLIDGLMVNGSASLVGWVAGKARKFQTGYLYDYAFAMIIGVVVLLGLFVFLSQ